MSGKEENQCATCEVLKKEIERLRTLVNDVAVGRKKTIWGWDRELNRMGYWVLPPSGCIAANELSQPTAIEAIEAAEIRANS